MQTHTFKPDLPPPALSVGVVGWLRANLFSSWFNTLLTLFAAYLVWLMLPPLIQWAFIDADWTGTTRADCTSGGACWVFVQQRFGQFMYGFYPSELRWRVDLTLWLAIFAAAPLFVPQMPRKALYGISFLVLFPLLAYWLLHGGFFGLSEVSTSQWGGLMLTLVIASVGITGALPLGILLALGRRSDMPAIRVLCVTFILFQSSYIAEVVRGGLQAIPKGQYEAAAAMGLGYWRMMGLVILPQALKLVIPGIVNTFIALFKDTSLVIIIGLFDLLNSIKQATTDPAWLGMATEGYVFAALIFWIFCFGMSRYSQHLERKLDIPKQKIKK